ncbi:FecR family protein [Parabacteroides pacaensis]|uniref:FecR family protein n=1 Tax=Parabacteroides pacaensis TaxID=2086575 RepID=UPI000D0FF052|nr:FecR family protein [Parabacteroides pacaensis]
MKMLPDDILINYLAGKASEEEKRKVENWLSQRKENEKIVEQFYFIGEIIKRLKVFNSVDPEQALAKLKKQIYQKNSFCSFRLFIQQFQQIAAVLFILVLFLSIYLFIRNRNEVDSYIEVHTNSGMQSFLELPDGSKVWINSGSYLKYPHRFEAGKREIFLEGQGYFEVVKNPHKPFIVKISEEYSVEVLGTEFNITAYKEDNYIETTLMRGKVKINIEGKESFHPILLPEQKATYRKDMNNLAILTVDSENERIWKDGVILFKKDSLEYVLRTLSRHYNTEFNIQDSTILNSQITMTFTGEPLIQVLEYLKLATGVNFHVQKEKTKQSKSIVELF